MLLAPLILFLAGLSAVGLGTPLVARLAPKLRGDAMTEIGLTGMAGVAVAALLAILVNFVAPVGIGVALTIFAGGTFLFAFGPARTLPLAAWFGYVILVLACAPLTVLLHGGVDGGVYHIPHQNWIVSEKVALGLANLYGRFGFDSLYEPLLSLGWLGGESLEAVPVVAALIPLFFVSALAGAIRDAKADPLLLYVIAMFSVGFLWIYGAVHVRTGWVNNDAPAALATLTCVYCGLRAAADDDRDFLALSLLFAGLAAALKLSAALVVFFPLGVAVLAATRGGGVPWRGIALCIVVFLPWVVRNIVVSGCLAFPYAESCLPVPWAAGAAGQDEASLVLLWARTPGVGNDQYVGWDWLPVWFERVRWFLVSLVGLAGLGVAVALTLGRGKPTRVPVATVIVLAVYAATASILWFIAGPSPRFGVAPLLSLTMLPGIYLAVAGHGKLVQWSPSGITAAIFGLSVAAAFGYAFLKGPVPEGKPAPYWASDIPIAETVLEGDVRRPATSGGDCFKAPIPCSPYGQTHEVRIGGYRAYYPVDKAIAR